MNNLVQIKKLIEFHDGAIKENFRSLKENSQKDKSCFKKTKTIN